MIKWIVLFILMVSVSQVGAVSYHVAKTGSGTICSVAEPCLTIATGVGKLAACDTLVIHTGIYVETLGLSPAIPSCSNGGYTTIQTGGDGQVTLAPGSGDFIFLINKSTDHIKLDGLVANGFLLDGAGSVGFPIVTNSDVTVPTMPHHISILNTEIKGGRHSGILVEGTQWFVQGNHIHHNGLDPQFDHGVYWELSQSTFTQNIVHDNACWGLQNFSSAGFNTDLNTFTRNKFYDNGCGGVFLGQGTDHLFINNIVYSNNSASGAGAFVVNQVITFYNNTFADDAGAGILLCCGATSAPNMIIKNNIIYNNAGGGLVGLASAQQSNNFTTNPLFTNAAAGDYSLQSGSGAIGFGLVLPGTDTDFNGTMRSVPYDAGAIEFTAGGLTETTLWVKDAQTPANTEINVIITPAVVIQVLDQFGNLMTGSTTTITIAIGTNPSAGTLSGTKVVAAVAGEATFNTLSINNQGGGYTLRATAAGLVDAVTNPFNITNTIPPEPDKLGRIGVSSGFLRR